MEVGERETYDDDCFYIYSAVLRSRTDSLRSRVFYMSD